MNKEQVKKSTLTFIHKILPTQLDVEEYSQAIGTISVEEIKKLLDEFNQEDPVVKLNVIQLYLMAEEIVDEYKEQNFNLTEEELQESLKIDIILISLLHSNEVIRAVNHYKIRMN